MGFWLIWRPFGSSCGAKMLPRASQDAPKAAPRRPKRAPRRPKMLPKPPKNPKIAPNLILVFPREKSPSYLDLYFALREYRKQFLIIQRPEPFTALEEHRRQGGSCKKGIPAKKGEEGHEKKEATWVLSRADRAARRAAGKTRSSSPGPRGSP